MTRTYGAIRDTHDTRDHMFLSRTGVQVPASVDLREWAGPIKDQGNIGKCTGESTASAREWIARKYGNASPILSGMFLYEEELMTEGSFPNDDGAMPRTACQMITQKGVCETSLYDDGQKFLPMTPAQAANALKWKTGAYRRLAGIMNVMSCLADPVPWPVLLAFQVPESFESQQVADTGIVPLPKPGEPTVGGHQTLCLGYDQEKQLVLVQNSWGDGWGQKGFFWLPFSIVSRPDTDLWLVHTGRPWVARSSLSTQAA